MKFTYRGTSYDFDTDTLTVAEGREIKAHAGMTLKQWQAGLEAFDVDALAALVYTGVRREGGTIDWSDLDEMNLVDFANSLVKDNNLDPVALARGEVTQLQNRADRRAAPKPRPRAARK